MIRVDNAWENAKTDILKKLRHYRSMVANYQACLELYNSMFPSGTQRLSDMPKAPAESFDVERWADARWDQKKRMERSLAEMQLEYINVERMIERLDGDLHTVLVRRYLLNESWEQIGVKMNYCERQIRRKHDHAIIILVDKMSDNVRE